MNLRGSWSSFDNQASRQLLLAVHQRANALREQRRVERLAERLGEDAPVKPARQLLIREEGDQNQLRLALPDIRRHGEGILAIEDETVRVQTGNPGPGFESVSCELEREVLVPHQLVQLRANAGVDADEEDLPRRFVFQLAQGHSVFLQETNQAVAGDATILRAGDPVATKATGIEPLTDGAGGYLADLCDLPGGKDGAHGAPPF